jgi:hypothetical protein
MPYVIAGDFNLSVDTVRDHLYAHAAREVVLSFGYTCHSQHTASDIDLTIVSLDALPLVTKYWKASSVLKTHDPITMCIQTKLDHFRCTAWIKPKCVMTAPVHPMFSDTRRNQEWDALFAKLISRFPQALTGSMGALRAPDFLTGVDDLHTLWLQWAQHELASNTATPMSTHWGAAYVYRDIDPLRAATRMAKQCPKAQLPGNLAQSLRLLTEIFGRHRAGHQAAPFALRFARWLNKASLPFEGADRLILALRSYAARPDIELLAPWREYLQTLTDSQTKQAVQRARESWKAQTEEWKNALHRKAFQLLRGQVVPGTESVPTPDGHSSAPCHVLAHHRKQWQHWWQATDSDLGYAAHIDQLLPDIPLPPSSRPTKSEVLPESFLPRPLPPMAWHPVL